MPQLTKLCLGDLRKAYILYKAQVLGTPDFWLGAFGLLVIFLETQPCTGLRIGLFWIDRGMVCPLSSNRVKILGKRLQVLGE